MVGRALITAGFVLVWACAALTADAQPIEQPVRIDYSAPDGCPTKDAFLAQIEARTLRLVESRAEGVSRAFTVVVARQGPRSTGHVSMVNADGSRAEREVVGDTCDQVVAALGLIVALAVDPNAWVGPARSSAPAPAVTTPPAPPPPPEPSSPPPPPPPPASSAAPPQPTPSTPILEEAPARTPERPRRAWRLALATGASALVGTSPRVLVGVPVYVQVASASHRILAPSFRVGIERATSGVIETQGTPPSPFLSGPAQVTFALTVALVEGCPVAWTSGSVRLEPCLRVEAGTLEGNGASVTPAHDVTSLWLDVGVIARVEWRIYGPLFLDLAAGLRVPLVEARFYFEPDATIYEAPTLGSMASAGLGVVIW